MNDSPSWRLQRPEFRAEIDRGDRKISALMKDQVSEVAAGTVLIAAGTEHPYVYRLLRGWACRTRLLEDGRNQFVLLFLPGDLFAVKSMMITQHPDAVETLSPVTLERVSYRDLHAAYRGDADVASRCLWQVMEEERRLHNWVVSLGQGNADERIAVLMLDLRARLADAGTIAVNGMGFDLPLTQAQLGDFLGLTAVHVNRVLRTLRENGALSVRDGVATILSQKKLVAIAYPLLDAYQKSSPAYTGVAGVAGVATE